MDPVELMSQWSFGGVDWLVIGLGIAVAYIVFGIAGFGTALVAGPILLVFMPLSKIIPLLVLLDFVAAFGNLLQSRRDVNKLELLRLLPCMAIGCTLGVVFLLNLHSDLLLLLMGLFYQRLCDLHLGGEGSAGATGGGLGDSDGHRRRLVWCVCSAVAAFYMRST